MTELRQKFENVKATLEYAGFGVDGLIMKSINELDKVVSRLEELAAPKFETRVYVVRIDECETIKDGLYWLGANDDEFMDESERQGLIYTIDLFENDFNTNVINQQSDLIRFITVEVSE